MFLFIQAYTHATPPLRHALSELTAATMPDAHVPHRMDQTEADTLTGTSL